jgi:hypothetical protein
MRKTEAVIKIPQNNQQSLVANFMGSLTVADSGSEEITLTSLMRQIDQTFVDL